MYDNSENKMILFFVGEMFASGGADKQVIIWGGNPAEGKLKYSHVDTVQRIAFNPVATQVLSCTATDIGKILINVTNYNLFRDGQK